MDIQIRKLVRKDRKILAGMIKKLADKIGDKRFLTMMTADPDSAPGENKKDESYFENFGIQILKLMLEMIEEDISAWFASLLNVTVEEFDALPFDIEIKIIDQLIQSEEANSFFTGALHLYRRIQGLADQLPTKKAA